MSPARTCSWEGELGLLQESTGPTTLGHSISPHLSEGLPMNHPENAIAHQQKENQGLGEQGDQSRAGQ